MAVAPHEVHQELPSRLARLAHALEDRFLGKDEIVRLLLIATIAGEHAVLVGPPGTAKSALIRTFARLMQARYFEYLLTRFTEPNEIFGPVDIAAFRDGRYERRTEGMLPDAEIVFLDEVFKSNSAILNSLLTLLNERRYTSGGKVIRCPLLSAFGASNEVPTDDDAHGDLRPLHPAHPQRQPRRVPLPGSPPEGARTTRCSSSTARPCEPLVAARELAALQRGLLPRTTFGEEFFSLYKGLVFQVRAEGDHAERSPRRQAAEALRGERVPRRPHAPRRERSLRAQARLEQRGPGADPRGHRVAGARGSLPRAPACAARRRGRSSASRRSPAKIERVRQVLTGASTLGDVQLFSQLKALGEVKTALASSTDPRAREILGRVDQLLEAAFQSGRFGQI